MHVQYVEIHTAITLQAINRCKRTLLTTEERVSATRRGNTVPSQIQRQQKVLFVYDGLL